MEMSPKSSVIMIALLVSGASLVVAGLSLFAVNGAPIGGLTFTMHSKPRAATAPNQSANHPAVAGASSAPSASALSSTMPSLSPTDALYPVAGSIVLTPANTPIAGHEIDIVGSVPAKTFTDNQGHFTAHLPVGHYTLRLNPEVGPGNQSWPFTVERQPLTLSLSAKSR